MKSDPLTTGFGGGAVLPIPDSFIDDLVGRTDIAELVSGYVRLTKRSGANMFGLCPFHSEKTPSFTVNSDKQIYYCFGCGKGGGAINFVMEVENIPFRDALEILAKRAGVTIPEDGTPDEIAGKRLRMLELNKEAARHFYDMLLSPAGSVARDYLTRRGIPKAIVTRFGIGAAPDSWTLLYDAMIKKGYSRFHAHRSGHL
jgi:DNA primase